MDSPFIGLIAHDPDVCEATIAVIRLFASVTVSNSTQKEHVTCLNVRGLLLAVRVKSS